MTVLGALVRRLAKGLQAMSDLFNCAGNTLNGLLPVMLSPAALTCVVKEYYRPVYAERFTSWALDEGEQWLEAWETEVLDCYRVRAGRMLVLGSGWGREAIAIARRGVSVVGIDTNPVAVRTAHRVATTAGLPARFHQADFMRPPYAPASWDYVLLASSMYSAVQGASPRQDWIGTLARLLKPEGLLILSFLPERRPISRRKVLGLRLNRLLLALPGTNRLYQPGDDCLGGHFLHAFQDEDEIRDELVGVGVDVRELNWARGFAVVAPLRREAAENRSGEALSAWGSARRRHVVDVLD